MIKMLTEADMLARITDRHCEMALQRASETHQFPHNVLAELVGVPTRIGKRALRRYKRKH